MMAGAAIAVAAGHVAGVPGAYGIGAEMNKAASAKIDGFIARNPTLVAALAVGTLAYSLYYHLSGSQGKEPTKRELMMALEREKAKTQMMIEHNRNSAIPAVAYGSSGISKKLFDRLTDIQGELEMVSRIRESHEELQESALANGLIRGGKIAGKVVHAGLSKLGSAAKFAYNNPGATVKKAMHAAKPVLEPSQVAGDKLVKSSSPVLSKIGKLFSTENQAKASAELFDSGLGPKLPRARQLSAFGTKVAGAVGDHVGHSAGLAAGGAALAGAGALAGAAKNDLSKTNARSVIKSTAHHSAVNGVGLGALSGLAGGGKAALVGGAVGAGLGAIKGAKRALGFQAKDAEKSAATSGKEIPEGYKMVFGRVVKIGAGTQPARPAQ